MEFTYKDRIDQDFAEIAKTLDNGYGAEDYSQNSRLKWIEGGDRQT